MKRFFLFLFVAATLPLSSEGGENVIPLEDRRAQRTPGGEVLIAKYYKVPENYLLLTNQGQKKGEQLNWEVSSGMPFGQRPSIIYSESRHLIIAKTTAAQHRLIEAHVNEVWKKQRSAARQGAGKKQ